MRPHFTKSLLGGLGLKAVAVNNSPDALGNEIDALLEFLPPVEFLVHLIILMLDLLSCCSNGVHRTLLLVGLFQPLRILLVPPAQFFHYFVNSLIKPL